MVSVFLGGKTAVGAAEITEMMYCMYIGIVNQRLCAHLKTALLVEITAGAHDTGREARLSVAKNRLQGNHARGYKKK